MSKAIRYVLYLAVLCVSSAGAEPSKVISQMIYTPPSLFDQFLYRIYRQARCDDRKLLCMSEIDYDYDDNVVETNFIALRDNPQFSEFSKLNEEEKEEVLISVMNDVLCTLGIKRTLPDVKGMSTKFCFKRDLIHSTPIRYGWTHEGIGVDDFRSEIGRRMVIRLSAPPYKSDKFSYILTRSHHGKMRFEKKKQLHALEVGEKITIKLK